jgi:NADH dehydrogenase
VSVDGFPAWSLWVGVHLLALLGGRNRIQTMINMAFRYFAWPKSAAGIIGDITDVAPRPE